MINHEAVVWVACAISTCLGYAIGRYSRAGVEGPPVKPRPPAPKMQDSVESPHPYRDAATLGDEGSPAPKKKRFRLFAYLTHDKKYVYLCCPACQGVVENMPVCTCDEVRSEPFVHFHTKCSNCGLRFAMETAAGAADRRRREKEAAAEAPKPTEPPKAN